MIDWWIERQRESGCGHAINGSTDEIFLSANVSLHNEPGSDLPMMMVNKLVDASQSVSTR